MTWTHFLKIQFSFNFLFRFKFQRSKPSWRTGAARISYWRLWRPWCFWNFWSLWNIWFSKSDRARWSLRRIVEVIYFCFWRSSSGREGGDGTRDMCAKFKFFIRNEISIWLSIDKLRAFIIQLLLITYYKWVKKIKLGNLWGTIFQF